MKEERRGDCVHKRLRFNQEKEPYEKLRLSLTLEEISIARDTPMMSVIINTGSANYERLQEEVRAYCLNVKMAHKEA